MMLQTEELQTAREQRRKERLADYREAVRRLAAGEKFNIKSLDPLLTELNIRDADLVADVQALKDHQQLVEDCRQFEAGEAVLAKKMKKLKEQRIAARDRVLHATRYEVEAVLRENKVGKLWNKQRAREDRLALILANRRLFDPPSDAA